MASAAVKVPTRSEVLSLFRSLLRTGRGFSDYNVREYTRRRTIDAFRSNRGLSDAQSVSAAYADGKAQLEVAKRQAYLHCISVWYEWCVASPCHFLFLSLPKVADL